MTVIHVFELLKDEDCQYGGDIKYLVLLLWFCIVKKLINKRAMALNAMTLPTEV